MAIAEKLRDYLQRQNVAYELVEHVPTASSMESAEEAHVPGDSLAKGVVVKEDGEVMLVVLPADYLVELESLRQLLQRTVTLAPEEELGGLFPDCALGAVPPVGAAYGLRTLWDPGSSLGRARHIYFEAGDHERLVRVSGEDFRALMAETEEGRFSHHV